MVLPIFQHITPIKTKQDLLDEILARVDVIEILNEKVTRIWKQQGVILVKWISIAVKKPSSDIEINPNGFDLEKVKIIVASEGTEHEIAIYDNDTIEVIDLYKYTKEDTTHPDSYYDTKEEN